MAVQLKPWQGLFCIQTVTNVNTVISWLLSLWPYLHCHDGCHPWELHTKTTPLPPMGCDLPGILITAMRKETNIDHSEDILHDITYMVFGITQVF